MSAHIPKIVQFAIGLGVGVLLLAGAFFTLHKASGSRISPLVDSTGDAQVLSETAPGSPQPLPSDVKTLGVALFGYGGAGHDGGYLTDAIQMLFINFEKQTVYLISVPRDLWVKTSRGEQKINAVMVAGGSNDKDNLVKTGGAVLKTQLSEITGLPLNYFVGIDFVGYQRAIGQNLKGIEVEVSETLEDPWYPIKGEELNLCGMSPQQMKEVHEKYSGFELERQFTCRYKHLLFQKGTVTMQGGEALEYVRSRHGSSEGDISRGKRQQEVLKAVQKKIFTLDGLSKLPAFFNDISKNTTTDIDVDAIRYLAPLLKNVNNFTVKTINLGPSNVLTGATSAQGASIMVPRSGMHNWTGVAEYIKSETTK